MQLAPWLRPTDTLGAIHAGAGLGMQLRQQDAAEQNATDVLRQRQEELFAQNERARETMDARKGEAAARLTQSAAQLALQAGHYEEAKKMQEAGLALRERSQKFREAQAIDKAAGATGETGDIMAENVVDAAGNVLGHGVRGANRGVHMLPSQKSGDIPLTPTVMSGIGRSAAAELLRINGTDPQREAELKATIAQVNDASAARAFPGRKPLVPQVVPRMWPMGPTTNWVPSSAVAPAAAAPAVDEAAKAYGAINGGKDPGAVRAKYKAVTGKELPWPQPQ